MLSGPFDFSKPDDRAKLVDLMAPLNIATKTCDGTTYVAYLATLPQVKTATKIGVVGYCMGGPYTILTAAAVPERVAAGVSLHGANLVTDKPNSPHLLIPKLKASYYFGIATNDDQRQPDAKDKLREAFTAAHPPAKIERVTDGCQHGWCVSDGMVYNKVGAERAYDQEIALYKKGAGLIPAFKVQTRSVRYGGGWMHHEATTRSTLRGRRAGQQSHRDERDSERPTHREPATPATAGSRTCRAPRGVASAG